MNWRGLLPGVSEGVLEVVLVHNEHYIKGQQCLACVSGGLHRTHPLLTLYLSSGNPVLPLFWLVWLSHSQLQTLVFLNPSVPDLTILTLTFLLTPAFIFTTTLYLVIWSYHIIIDRKRKQYTIDELDLTVQLYIWSRKRNMTTIVPENG